MNVAVELSFDSKAKGINLEEWVDGHGTYLRARDVVNRHLFDLRLNEHGKIELQFSNGSITIESSSPTITKGE